VRRISLLLLLVCPVVFAGGDCKGHSCNNGGDVDVVTSLGGNSTRAYSVSGGDMDINDGLATDTYAFGLYQTTKPNRISLAEDAQRAGEIETAALLRCSYWTVRKAWGWIGGKKKCINALMFQYEQEVVQTPDLTDLYSQQARFEEKEDQNERQIIEQQAELDYVKAELARVQTSPDLERQLREDARRRANARKALQEANGGQ
jgi:hypothetical protein